MVLTRPSYRGSTKSNITQHHPKEVCGGTGMYWQGAQAFWEISGFWGLGHVVPFSGNRLGLSWVIEMLQHGDENRTLSSEREHIH